MFIPFYVNAIDNTLKMCLANPDIANNLVRYPIISSEYRYGVQNMLLVHNEYMSFLIPREIYHG